LSIPSFKKNHVASYVNRNSYKQDEQRTMKEQRHDHWTIATIIVSISNYLARWYYRQETVYYIIITLIYVFENEINHISLFFFPTLICCTRLPYRNIWKPLQRWMQYFYPPWITRVPARPIRPKVGIWFWVNIKSFVVQDISSIDTLLIYFIWFRCQNWPRFSHYVIIS
jgi:hypothetical protein